MNKNEATNNENKNENVVFIPMFIKDIADDVPYTIENTSLKINRNRQHVYVNPYGYAACIDPEGILANSLSETFNVTILKDEGKILFTDIAIIITDIVDECPAGWIDVPVTSRSLEDLDEKMSVSVPTDSLDQRIQAKWSDVSIEERMYRFIQFMISLENQNITEFSQVAEVKAMKKNICTAIQNTKDSIDLESLPLLIDDELEYRTDSDEDANKKSSKYSRYEAVTILKTIREVLEKKIVSLTVPKNQKGLPAKSTIKQLSLEDFKKLYAQYSAAEKEEFLQLVNTGSDEIETEDYHKASYINEKDK